MAISSVITERQATSSLRLYEDRAGVVDNLIQIIEKEYQKGNLSISPAKYNALVKLKKQREVLERKNLSVAPPLPAPLYPPLFYDFKVVRPQKPRKRPSPPSRKRNGKLTLKKLEAFLVALLESIANMLDSLHLFSKLPMFPKKLAGMLQHTNRLWAFILVFLVRKTISQLLNVIRKEKKVKRELEIISSTANSKLLDDRENNEGNIFRKYEKVLRDLKFDKMMLIIELVGNFLDLSFNVIELYAFPVPDWFMNLLNFASMGMTIYRMNKDDEYVDDDITDDLI